MVSIDFNNDYNILIGPNAGGKSNLLNIITIILRTWFLAGYYEPNQEFKALSSNYLHYICQNYIPNPNPPSKTFQYELFDVRTSLDKFIGDDSDSEIAISFEVSSIDIKNMNIIKNNIKKFEKKSSYKKDRYRLLC